MEYHVTHHMFPTVPSYNLINFITILRSGYRANDGLIDAYENFTSFDETKRHSVTFLKEVPEPQMHKSDNVFYLLAQFR